MADIVTTCVISFFLIILLAGFLFGLGRGFNKSLTRIFMVIASLVIAFFVTPKVTPSLMTLDISGFGFSVGGESAATVGDIFTILLKQVPAVNDIAGTDAFVKIMNVVPQLLLNVIIFILLFYILRLITMIAYWIISGICFNKKKTEGKNPRRLLGSVVGLVQNFVIFIALLVPIVGFTTVLGDIETTTQSYTPPTQAVAIAPTAGEAPLDDPNEGSDSNNAVSPYQTVTEVIDAYNNTWVAKFVSGIKLDKACMYVFNDLSTLTYDGVEYNLRNEANNLTIVYLDISSLLGQGGFDLADPNTILCLQALINDCYNSNLAADLIDEVVPLAAEKWAAGETFCGISCPTIAGFEDIITDILTLMQNSTNVQETLISMSNIIQSVMSSVNDLYVDGTLNIDKVTDLLDGLTSDPATMEIAKDIIASNVDNLISTILPNIEEGSAEETVANVITEVIDSLFNEDYSTGEHDVKNEVAVVSEALKVAQTLGNGESITQENADTFVEALSNSTVILNELTTVDSSVKSYIQDAIAYADATTSEGDKPSEMLTEAINGLTDASDGVKTLLLEILGIQIPQE